MFVSNHKDLVNLAIKSSGLKKGQAYQRLNVTRFAVSRWKSRNWVPEHRRKALADLSRGAVAVDDFTAAWETESAA